MTNEWKMKVTFFGNLAPKAYLTPDIRRNNPGWGDEIFNRVIEQLEFFLPTGHTILLSGMEMYNFFVEATQSLSGKDTVKIEAAWFCGKIPNEKRVVMYRVGGGRVIKQIKEYGKEWGGTATRGWKTGLIGEKPIAVILQPRGV